GIMSFNRLTNISLKLGFRHIQSHVKVGYYVFYFKKRDIIYDILLMFLTTDILISLRVEVGFYG
ncbi:MAG: hypothetical protein NWE83_03855, partial [Candidatus Bathyarchaeota archaeon]|nr:hypothetical protein [Candidatus Bathyarchaeota archaeon]